MKHFVVLLTIVAVTLTPALGADGGPASTQARNTDATTPVVLQEGDARLQLAHECLLANGDEKADQLLRILEATGFSLVKVTLKDTGRDPDRNRFGYEFTSSDLVKTVYWEVNCPSQAAESKIASR
jgi:hypothetical protein